MSWAKYVLLPFVLLSKQILFLLISSIFLATKCMKYLSQLFLDNAIKLLISFVILIIPHYASSCVFKKFFGGSNHEIDSNQNLVGVKSLLFFDKIPVFQEVKWNSFFLLLANYLYLLLISYVRAFKNFSYIFKINGSSDTSIFVHFCLWNVILFLIECPYAWAD